MLRDICEGEELTLSTFCSPRRAGRGALSSCMVSNVNAVDVRMRAIQGWLGGLLVDAGGLFENAETHLTGSDSCLAGVEPRFPLLQRLLPVI